MASNVIWTPQPKQAEFMRRWEDEALYGGAAGGGKSDCALAEALRQVDNPHYKGLILRKTYPQLSDLIDRSRAIYKASYPRAKFNESKHTWRFPSGAQIVFGSLQHTKDRLNYQGKAYDYIDFDELTQFLWDEYSYLMSRNRPTGPGTRVYMRAQANPGGVGHGWVKARFITPAPPLTTIYEDVKIRYPDGKELIRRKSRVFVPSTVFDNRILMANDPEYIARLAALPEQDRKALLYGDWDSFSGQVFIEWRNDPDHYTDQLCTHVVAPFHIPANWKIMRSFDWGYARPFSVGWYAIDTEGRIWRIRELYGCTGTPNEGVKWTASDLARKIREIEREDPNMNGRRIFGIADPSIYQQNGGESIGDLMAREGVYWDKADNSRIPGKMQIHNRLAFDTEGRPSLYIFSTCTHAIRTLPALVYSQVDIEDVDTTGEDHIYDELRYICMAHPINPPKSEPKLQVFSPLDIDTPAYTGRFDYYLR